jgi:hypothetical protein
VILRRTLLPFRAPGRALALVLVVVCAAACGDSTSVDVPQVRVTVDPQLNARAGETLDRPIRIEVQDKNGAGLANVPVTLRILEGGGAIDRPQRTTDSRGLIELRAWTMGDRPGLNRLSVEVQGAEPVEVSVQAGAGPPAMLEPIGTVPARAPVATSLSQLPQVRVTDRFNNPIAGLTIIYRPSSGGTVADSALVSNAEGLTRQSSWRLGPLAGPQTLQVSVTGAPDLVLSIQADPGPAARFTWDTPQDQGVEVGLFVVHSPTARVTDEHGNAIAGVAVTFQVQSGGGRVEGISGTTDATGRARVARWYVGSQPGPNTLGASAAGFTSIVLSARALPTSAPLEGRYFTVPAVHVNQGSQSSAGDIPLVAGRAGLLRIFVQASEGGAPAPEVEVRVSRNGTLLHTERLAPPSAEAPTALSADQTTGSWNLPVPATWVSSGLAVEVVVDPEGLVGVTTRKVARFPLEGSAQALNVVSPPPFRVRFLPLRDRTSGQQGDVHALNLDGFMEGARRLLPIGALEVTLAPAFTTDLLTSEGQVRSVLQDLLAAWAASTFRNHYFHGIFPAASVGGLDYYGIATVPSSPNSPSPVAQSWDRLPQAAYTVAHELGHNLGRRHAPCGNPAGVDPAYPYGGARLGVSGWDVIEQVSRNPGQYYDMMSYCNPEWISDFNFRRILEWRMQSPMGAPQMTEAPESPGLLVWGGVRGSRVELQPAFPVTAAPLLPTGGGSYRLVGSDASGAEVFRLDFEPSVLVDGTEGLERHFAFVVPVPTSVRVARIDLQTPSGAAARVSAFPELPALAPFGPLPATVSGAPGAQTLTWSTSGFPLAILRDRDSGEITGFDRSGRLELRTLGENVEVLLSDGIRGWRVTPLGLVEP